MRLPNTKLSTLTKNEVIKLIVKDIEILAQKFHVSGKYKGGKEDLISEGYLAAAKYLNNNPDKTVHNLFCYIYTAMRNIKIDSFTARSLIDFYDEPPVEVINFTSKSSEAEEERHWKKWYAALTTEEINLVKILVHSNNNKELLDKLGRSKRTVYLQVKDLRSKFEKVMMSQESL